MCITHFCTFLCCHCTTTLCKWLISHFIVDINKQQQFFGMSAVPKTLLWEISRPAFDILQQTGINSKKFEKNMNSF